MRVGCPGTRLSDDTSPQMGYVKSLWWDFIFQAGTSPFTMRTLQSASPQYESLRFHQGSLMLMASPCFNDDQNFGIVKKYTTTPTQASDSDLCGTTGDRFAGVPILGPRVKVVSRCRFYTSGGERSGASANSRNHAHGCTNDCAAERQVFFSSKLTLGLIAQSKLNLSKRLKGLRIGI